MEKTELTTVPTFTFKQGFDDLLPIVVNYYHASIELKQDGNSIVISTEDLTRIFEEIKRHLPEAQKALNR